MNSAHAAKHGESVKDELRTKIENYKRTREWSKGHIRSWCDALIAEAEHELGKLIGERHPGQHLDAEADVRFPFSPSTLPEHPRV